MNNEILKLKMELVKMGWQIEERTGTDGWADGKIGYTIWISRPDWHGKDIYSLITRPEMHLHGLCDDATNEEKMLKTVKDLKTLAEKAWNEFPNSVPVQNAYGELVDEVLFRKFSDGRSWEGEN